jgi:hypothetical protein
MAHFPTDPAASNVVEGPAPTRMVMQFGDGNEGLLPAEARTKLREIDDETAESHLLLLAVIEQQQGVRLDIQRGESRIKGLKMPCPRRL